MQLRSQQCVGTITNLLINLGACSTSWQWDSWFRYGMQKLRHCHPIYFWRSFH